MRLKLDENLSLQLKHKLAPAGHDISTTADEGLLGEPDGIVGDAAKSEGRILLTLDVEFANLKVYAPGTHPGIILFRPRTFGPLTVNRFVEAFVQSHPLSDFAGCVVVVEPGRVRVRRPDGPIST